MKRADSASIRDNLHNKHFLYLGLTMQTKAETLQIRGKQQKGEECERDLVYDDINSRDGGNGSDTWCNVMQKKINIINVTYINNAHVGFPSCSC